MDRVLGRERVKRRSDGVKANKASIEFGEAKGNNTTRDKASGRMADCMHS